MGRDPSPTGNTRKRIQMLVAGRFRKGRSLWPRRRPDGENGDDLHNGIDDNDDGASTGWREAVTDAVSDTLAQMVKDRMFATGGQAAVYVDGSLVANAAAGVTGSGQLMRPDHLHHGFCVLKPLPFLMLAATIEQAGFGPDDPLESIVELPEWCPTGLTARSLASHADGLARPSGMEWFSTRPSNRPELLATVKRDKDPAYSDWVGSLIADQVVERIVGQSGASHCFEMLLEPLGLADNVMFADDGDITPGGSRLQSTVTGLPNRAIPTINLAMYDAGMASLALGGVATMGGVAGVFAAIGEVMDGKPVPGLPSPELLADLTAPENLNRKRTSNLNAWWGGGLIHNLEYVNISKSAGPGSVGHMGGLAEASALYDPTRRAAVAVFANGANTSFDSALMTRLIPMDYILRSIPLRAERDGC